MVHAALATVDFEADAAGIEAVVRAQARLIGASDPEAKAAACAVSGALANPLLLRAAACAARGDLRRETPVLLRRPDGTLVEGVVDLAFRELAQGAPLWTVVDFKTDREVEAARERYAAQVALYVEAVAAATGEPARGILLVV